MRNYTVHNLMHGDPIYTEDAIPLDPAVLREFFNAAGRYGSMPYVLMIRPRGFWGDTTTLRIARTSQPDQPLRIETTISTSSGGRERGVDDLTAYHCMALTILDACAAVRAIEAIINRE